MSFLQRAIEVIGQGSHDDLADVLDSFGISEDLFGWRLNPDYPLTKLEYDKYPWTKSGIGPNWEDWYANRREVCTMDFIE
jgi:hypothetical protein